MSTPDSRLEAKLDPIDTPECDKLADAHDTRMAIADFLEWLECEKGIGVPRVDDLIVEYLGIDPVKLEKERRALLAAYREAQEEGES